MLPGPVFTVELITTSRRARYYALRTIYGFLVLFFIVQTAPWVVWRSNGQGVRFEQMAQIGGAIFAAIVGVQSVAVLFLTPAFLAGVIAEEKRRKTLQYLLASSLTGAEIVFGKLAARLLHLGLYLTIGVPILVLASLFGGVDPSDVALWYAGTVSTMLFLASVSIFFSVHARRARDAIIQTYLFELAWLFLPSILEGVNPGARGFVGVVYGALEPLIDLVGLSSPFYTFSHISVSPGEYTPVFGMIGIQAVLSVVLLSWSALRLRPLFRREGERGRWGARIDRLRKGRRLLPRPPCGDDAMLWKERYLAATSTATKVGSALLLLIGAALLAPMALRYATHAFAEIMAYGYWGEGPGSARYELNIFLRILGAAIYVVWALATATAAASSVAGEREEDTWTSLTATPLEGPEIVRAKLLGALWRFRVLGLLLLSIWSAGVALGAIHPLGIVLAVIATSVYVWYAAALGLFVSLCAKSSGRSLVATVSILLASNVVYFMCCIPLRPGGPWFLAGATYMFVSLAPIATLDGRNVDLNVGQFIVAGVFSVLGYGCAAGILTGLCLSKFDELVDRPRRQESWPGSPGPPPKKPPEDDDESDLA